MWRRVTSFLFVAWVCAATLLASPEDQSLQALGLEPGRSAVLNGRAFLVVDDGVHGEELWTTDGTASGTSLLRDIHPGPPGSSVSSLTVVGGHVFPSPQDSPFWAAG